MTLIIIIKYISRPRSYKPRTYIIYAHYYRAGHSNLLRQGQGLVNGVSG